jgi:predicted Zn-dependent protease
MKALCVLLLGLLACACATNPATGRRQLMLMSEAEELQLGRQSDVEVRSQMGVYRDAQLQAYVDRVGQRLARAAHRPNLPWTFTVVDEQAVNAFALPGGFIYLTRGILPFLRNEAELAAVLGHEIGHVDARHSASAYSRQQLAGASLALGSIFVPATRPFQGALGVGLQLAFLGNSRGAELEADQLGVAYSSTSGWDPTGMPGLLDTLGRLDSAVGTSRGVPNWALTHPPAADRVAKVQEAVTNAGSVPGARATNEAEFSKSLDGLVFGDSREKGLVRGNEFLHPVLRFAVAFPSGWDVVNGDKQVTALESEQGNIAMVLQVAKVDSGSVEQAARTAMTSAGFREVEGNRVEIHGLPAYVGTYQGLVDKTLFGVRAAHVQSGGQTYVIAGLAPASTFSRVDQTILRSIQSFHELTPQQAERIQPNRVDFYTARPGDTWESIAREAGGGTVKASTLAIMNGREATTPPRSGERLRIVVAG